MSIEQMRTVLAEVYKGDKWKKKLMSMPERQIFAIYKDLERKGKLKKGC